MSCAYLNLKKKGSAGLDHVKSNLKSQRERVGQPGSLAHVQQRSKSLCNFMLGHHVPQHTFYYAFMCFFATLFKTYGLFIYIALN